jgi:hypothetical protein
MCDTAKGWDFAYQSARKVLADDPKKCSKLDDIYNNPSRQACLVECLAALSCTQGFR